MKSLLTAHAIVFAAVVLSFFVSCSGKGQMTEQVDKVDSIIAAYKDDIYTEPVEARAVFEKAQRETSDSVNHYKLELFKGIAGLISGNGMQFDSAQKVVDDYCRRNPEAHVVAGISWNHKGMVQHSMGNTDSAEMCYVRSSEELTKARDWARLCNVCISLADLYGSQGNMAASAGYYRRVLFLTDSLDFHDYDFSVLSGLAKVYADMGNYSESRKYFDMARPMAEKSSDFQAFFFYNSEGNGEYFRKHYDNALSAFRKAYEIACRMGEESVLAIAETNLGEVLMCKDNLDSARYYIKKAESRFNAIPSLDYSSRFYMCSLLAGLALRENNIVEAHKYLQSAVIDTAVLRPKYLSLHYRRLQEYSVKTNDYRNAYRYEKLAQRYDSVLSSDMVRSQMAEIRYRYDQDTTLLHRNIMISEQAEEMKELSMWNSITVVAIVLLLIIAILYFAYRKKVESVARLEMERSLMALRVENIRNRVSPHFIFNVLNRELNVQNEGVNRLVKLLRMNLDLCDRYIVSLSDEIEFINIYVELERKAQGKDFNYILDIDSGVDTDLYHLPSMMIQIFVENALKHGLRGVDGEKWLHLSVKHVSSALEILVENNGSNHGVVSGRVGTGLKVVLQTIHMLNEYNTEKLKLDYGGADEQGVWIVKITIPDGYDFSLMQ